VRSKVAFDHQIALIERLIEVNCRLEARVNSLEAAQGNNGDITSANYGDHPKRPRDEDESVPVKCRRRSKTIPLVDTWFAWYTAIPRGWLDASKHKKSDAKQLVTFMRLFIETGTRSMGHRPAIRIPSVSLKS